MAGCLRELRKFDLPNRRQRDCVRLQNDRRQESRARCSHGVKRRRLHLIGWRTAGIDRATPSARSGRTVTGHLAGRRYCQERLRSRRNRQQEDYQRIFHESKTHLSTKYSRRRTRAPSLHNQRPSSRYGSRGGFDQRAKFCGTRFFARFSPCRHGAFEIVSKGL